VDVEVDVEINEILELSDTIYMRGREG